MDETQHKLFNIKNLTNNERELETLVDQVRSKELMSD